MSSISTSKLPSWSTPSRTTSLPASQTMGVAIVIATEAHHEALAMALETVGIDTAGPRPAAGKLLAEFAAERASPGQARRLVLGALAEWGCGLSLLRDAAVVVSELATNAVLHAASSFSLSVTLEDSLLRIVVHDARPLSVTVGGVGLNPQPTHGLGLVEALSLRWGAEGTAQGKAVWAELGASDELASDELQASH